MAVRIAVVQQESNPGQVQANRRKAMHFARIALGQGADLILFPEEILVGYVENLRDLAEPLDGPTTAAFAALLRGSSTMVLYGLTERDGTHYYNSATLVGANGVLANYRKTHLWWASSGARYEPAFFDPGDRLVTFDLRGHKAGVMICYDGDFPETTRSYADLGCEILFWLNNRPSRGHEEVRPLAQANSIIIAAACVNGQDERGRVCRGGSNVTGASGELLAEIWDQEGVICVDVHLEQVLASRQRNPLFIGRRRDLYS